MHVPARLVEGRFGYRNAAPVWCSVVGPTRESLCDTYPQDSLVGLTTRSDMRKFFKFLPLIALAEALIIVGVML